MEIAIVSIHFRYQAIASLVNDSYMLSNRIEVKSANNKFCKKRNELDLSIASSITILRMPSRLSVQPDNIFSFGSISINFKQVVSNFFVKRDRTEDTSAWVISDISTTSA